MQDGAEPGAKGGHFRIVRVAHEDRGEFVTTKPRKLDGCTRLGGQPFADFRQQAVPRAMPMHVIDGFEAVQVDQRQEQA